MRLLHNSNNRNVHLYCSQIHKLLKAQYNEIYTTYLQHNLQYKFQLFSIRVRELFEPIVL